MQDYEKKARRIREASCLIQAMNEASGARAAVERARASYDGYSFDYYYRDMIEEAERKEEAVLDAIDAYVEKKIAEALAKASA